MYFGDKEFTELHDRRIFDAYQAGSLSICVESSVWWYEKCPSDLLDRITSVRMAEMFTYLNYMEEIIRK